jgi:alpha-N-arabinofuranosidase
MYEPKPEHKFTFPSQLLLDGIRPSGGLYAPTIRYHERVFYVINTLVDGLKERGNFVVTATDPAGPWSEPHWLDDAPGIEPSLLFDDDGRVWYTGNRVPLQGPSYPRHKEIWLQELDLETIIDCTGKPPMKDTTVVVEGDKIAELKPGVHKEVAGEGERVFDLEGGYVLPGLWNVHVHMSVIFPDPKHTLERESVIDCAIRAGRNCVDALRHGVTGMRVVGGARIH